MFQIIDLILSSPIGAFIATVLRDTIYAVMILSECAECGFEDLGKLLIGGIALAVLVGIAASLLWRRARDKNSSTASFVSIKSNERD
jgi:hypothetical protein